MADRLAAAALDDRRAHSLFRTRRVIETIDATRVRVEGRVLINFSGNDYLGLSHHPAVVAALANTTAAGSGAAALVSGRAHAHADAERVLAVWKGVDDAILLPSGYQANVAAIQTMAGIGEAGGRKVRFIVDKLAHASLIDAVRSTQCELRIIPHNGVEKLDRFAADRDPNRFDVVVTESIFSMDGDPADLDAICALKMKYGFGLIVDEAHATGVYGPTGAGLVSARGLTRHVDLGIATFSKALGVIGGAVYGSKTMIEAAVNFGRAYVFTTSPPPGVAAAISTAIEIARADGARRERLRENVRRLRDGIASRGTNTVAGDSPIVPIILGDDAATLAASDRLRTAGFLVVAVRPPTVPKGTSRLRVTVGSEHSREQIDALVGALRG